MLAGAVLLSGCTTPPPEPLSLASSKVEPVANWSAEGVLSGPVNEAWLERLGESQLNALVAESLLGNQALRAAAARAQAARARARIAGAAQLPRLDLGIGAARRGSGSGGRRTTANSFDTTLSASLEADLWGRVSATTRAAALDALGSEADYAAARLSLVANVARAWFNLVEATLQVQLAQEAVSNFRDNLAVVEDRFRAGLNSALDVRLERANLAGAESRLEARRVDRDLAARTLEVVLGRYPSDRLRPAMRLPGLGAAVPAGVPAAVLDRRPDLRVARLRLEANNARVSVALKNRLPKVTLTASGGLSSSALRQFLDFDSLLFAIAADLAAPLLRGGELQGERDLARAEASEALATYADAVLNAFREVESALTAGAQLARQQVALETAARESSAAEDLALELYRSGLTDIVTWLEARRRAFDARSSLLSVSNQRLQNRISLHLALGGDFAPAGSDEEATRQ